MRNTPPTYFYIGILIAAIPYFLLPQFNMIPFPFNWLGLLLLLAGLLLNMLAIKEFEKHNTPHNFATTTTLVNSGLYKFSRNPIYLGMALGLVGIAILFQNPVSMLAPLFFLLVLEFKFIPYEEEKLTLEMGEAYLQYKQRVRRWI